MVPVRRALRLLVFPQVHNSCSELAFDGPAPSFSSLFDFPMARSVVGRTLVHLGLPAYHNFHENFSCNPPCGLSEQSLFRSRLFSFSKILSPRVFFFRYSSTDCWVLPSLPFLEAVGTTLGARIRFLSVTFAQSPQKQVFLSLSICSQPLVFF